jgi:hypothetical protein
VLSNFLPMPPPEIATEEEEAGLGEAAPKWLQRHTNI